MNMITDAFNQIANNYNNPALNTSTILSVLGMTLVLSLLEFLVYRTVSQRKFYDKSFNICLAIIPFFISTIILSLQSNIVITLGTIGALAIIRFRTAIKNPVDMLYVLWSVHIGITCGCQLYELAVATFILVTILLIIFEYAKFGRCSYVLVFHDDEDDEATVEHILKDNCKTYRIKSKNYTPSGIDYVVDMTINDTAPVAGKLKDIGIEKFSIIEYDNEDII